MIALPEILRGILELDLGLQLNHPRRRATTQDADGRLSQERDLPERLVRSKVIRGAKIGVVEEVEELKPDSQHGIFPTRNFRVLGDGEVGIEVPRCAEVIASLGERHNRTAHAKT